MLVYSICSFKDMINIGQDSILFFCIHNHFLNNAYIKYLLKINIEQYLLIFIFILFSLLFSYVILYEI